MGHARGMTALLYSVDTSLQTMTLTQQHARVEMLRLDGPDAMDFAHAQLASDVRSLNVGRWQWSAWLDARGRVQTFGQLARDETGGLCYFLRGGVAESIADHLRRYVFRSRVTIDAPGARYTTSAESLDSGVFQRKDDDTCMLGLGERSLCLQRAAPCSIAPSQGHPVLADIVAGFPWLPDGLPAQLPPALGLYRLGAVRVDKGCYPGQEIVSRLHHLGGAKQHLHHLRRREPEHEMRISSTAGAGGWELLRAGEDVLAVLDDRSAAQPDDFEIVRSFAD